MSTSRRPGRRRRRLDKACPPAGGACPPTGRRGGLLDKVLLAPGEASGASGYEPPETGQDRGGGAHRRAAAGVASAGRLPVGGLVPPDLPAVPGTTPADAAAGRHSAKYRLGGERQVRTHPLVGVSEPLGKANGVRRRPAQNGLTPVFEVGGEAERPYLGLPIRPAGRRTCAGSPFEKPMKYSG